MYWFILFLAGILEAGWLVGIQKIRIFTNIPYVYSLFFQWRLV